MSTNPTPASTPNDQFVIGRGKASLPKDMLINTSGIPTPNEKIFTQDGKTTAHGSFSHSSLSCYAKCQKMYEFEYVKKMRRERGAPKLWNGSAVHAALEAAEIAQLNGIPVTADAIKTVYSTTLDSNVKMYEGVLAEAKKTGTPMPEIDWGERITGQADMDKLGRDLIDIYMRDIFPKTKVIAVEKVFVYNFPVKSGGTVPIVGFIDLVEEHEGEPCITDHKVGRKRTQDDLEDSDQLTLYSWVEKIPQVAYMSYVPGTTGGKTPSRARPGEILKLVGRRTVKDYERTHEDFEGLLQGIKSGIFARTGKSNSMICGSNCPYYDVCLKGK